MKKLCSFLFILILLNNLNVSEKTTCAKVQNNVYAKALSECKLYKSETLSDDISNVYFIVPESYFVLVVDNVSTDCLRVQYREYVGYVKSTDVVLATFSPIVKTLDGVTCDVKQTSGTQVWSLPSSKSGMVLTTIQAGTKNINYIGSIYGEIPSGGQTNVWYYVEYTPLNNSTNVYYGYVYSENITNLSDIVLNTEVNPEIISENNNLGNEIYISTTIKTLIVAIITIPIILFLAIILYKFIKKFKNNTNKQEKINLETSQKNEIFNHNDDEFQNDNFVLKNGIEKFKHGSFVKKEKPVLKRNTNFYPDFPSYSSDDDLL